ncbi:molybdenum cofactor biosynthesis protein MoaE [Kordiimonas sp. SCSIO 12610]|uniref:molybdenum cofactor biosynthesis protein MoaE n=1 Tax=Kordiimonas sp. SCSIO 12610 TaxID=2829597 RepID=UPI002109C686|nr:molybdenum cofactor biosynthesis protein MoaE [Kordiimonas sp. SCSIO 12610]UTW56417.1 molybdenum cofactor biosynthesis protein MoaE [Kordiimonas sp. SCSIO 12610]
MSKISVQNDDFDIGAEIELIRQSRTDIGAVVSFTGTVRDTLGDLSSMTLEHYPGMTEKELERIAATAYERWPILDCTIIHRVGRMEPGDNIVLVITASPHRKAAFESAEFLMDFLKTNATIWKKEATNKGENWVDAKSSDDDALERW